MTIIRLTNLAVDMSDVTNVEIRPSLLSLAPKIIAVPTICAGLFMVSWGGSMILGAFHVPYGVKTTFWDTVGMVVLAVVMFVLGLALAYSATKVITSSERDHDAIGAFKWFLGAGIFFCLFGAALNLNMADNFSQAQTEITERYKMVQSNKDQAGYLILAAAGFVLAYLSLGLVGFKDAILSGNVRVRRVKGLDRVEADTLLTALVQK